MLRDLGAELSLVSPEGSLDIDCESKGLDLRGFDTHVFGSDYLYDGAL
jgi:hypothetical protein